MWPGSKVSQTPGKAVFLWYICLKTTKHDFSFLTKSEIVYKLHVLVRLFEDANAISFELSHMSIKYRYFILHVYHLTILNKFIHMYVCTGTLLKTPSYK